jgi:hypothetical protein
MNTRDNSESRELTLDELNHVSGGVVCITATQPLPNGSGGGTGKIIIEGGYAPSPGVGFIWF